MTTTARPTVNEELDEIFSLGGDPNPDATTPVAAFIATHAHAQRALREAGPAHHSLVHIDQQILLAGPQPLVDATPLASVGSVRRHPAGGALLELETQLREGEVLRAELFGTVLLGGAQVTEDSARLAPRSRRRAEPAVSPPISARIRVGGDRVTRYADISGDTNPIHLEDDAARAAGFEGRIAHGMSIFGMALTHAAQVAAETEDHLLLTGCGVRFALPVLVGQEIELRAAATGVPGTLAISAVGPDGPVLKSGWVQFIHRGDHR